MFQFCTFANLHFFNLALLQICSLSICINPSTPIVYEIVRAINVCVCMVQEMHYGACKVIDRQARPNVCRATAVSRPTYFVATGKLYGGPLFPYKLWPSVLLSTIVIRLSLYHMARNIGGN